jgi:hypothetical protein
MHSDKHGCRVPGIPHEGVHYLPPLFSRFLLNAGALASRSSVDVSLRYGIMPLSSVSWLLACNANKLSEYTERLTFDSQLTKQYPVMPHKNTLYRLNIHTKFQYCSFH